MAVQVCPKDGNPPIQATPAVVPTGRAAQFGLWAARQRQFREAAGTVHPNTAAC